LGRTEADGFFRLVFLRHFCLAAVGQGKEVEGKKEMDCSHGIVRLHLFQDLTEEGICGSKIQKAPRVS
jgi:hypothetical protein